MTDRKDLGPFEAQGSFIVGRFSITPHKLMVEIAWKRYEEAVTHHECRCKGNIVATPSPASLTAPLSPQIIKRPLRARRAVHILTHLLQEYIFFPVWLPGGVELPD